VLSDLGQGTWKDSDDIKKMQEEDNKFGLYMTSFYYTVTTITTVGYGDISGTNVAERSIATIIMLIGVIGFSFGTGSLASVMSTYDQTNAGL